MKIPTRGTFRMISMTFPMYMLAIRPQNTSGCFEMKSGPG